jgi:LPXTG-site transpeptidase (sortase) family protein
MAEKYLLLPSANTVVLHQNIRHTAVHYIRLGALAVGVLCVLLGAVDLAKRVSNGASTMNIGQLGLAPAITLYPPEAVTGVVGSTTVEVIVPSRLRIPSLGVDAEVESVGVKEDGTMGTPKDFDNVGWYAPGARPGESGSAVFSGHVNNALLKPGIFEQLSQIKKGDYITVENTAGKRNIYRVDSVEEYPADAYTESIFAHNGPSQLVLITCDGVWVPAKKTFDKRLVVIAKPAY